jgi:hypothetical protein
LWQADFPAETARIKAEQAGLGFSFEADCRFRNLTDQILEIEACTFSGCAVLEATAAAYGSLTSLAASGDGSATNALERARVGPKPTEPTAYDRTRTAALLNALRKAGIAPPSSGRRLSSADLGVLLAEKSISERINLRMLVRDAGIEPVAG